MRAINTILAATDFTARSDAVMARAAGLARSLGCRVVLAHAVSRPKALAPRLRKARRIPRTEDQAQDALAQLAAAYPELEISLHGVEGAADQVIADLARQHAADLVIMGLHKPRAVLETLRSTTMERITLDVPCPVLIAHDRNAALPYRRVLGAITFAPASAEALRMAAIIAPGAEFHAIHALQLPLSEKLPQAEPETCATMTEAELLRSAFMRLDGVPDSLHLPEIVPGGVHEVLQFRIQELQPDLVVLGSHSGRDPSSLGNYARDLMRDPPTDLLIAKPV